MTPEVARERFAQARVAVLGSIGPDRLPHLVPIVFAVDGEAVLAAIDDKPKRAGTLQRLINIEADPRVTLLAHGYDEDWTRLWWVRAEGTAQVILDGPMRQRAVAVLTERYPQYRSGWSPAGPALVIHVERWVGWEA